MEDCELIEGDALEVLPRLRADLVFGSPPYIGQRTYGRDDVARGPREWVAWMLEVSRAALTCAPHCVWVVAGGRENTYVPSPEGLAWEWFLSGGEQDDVAIWSKNGLPGTGGSWLRRNHEFLLSFRRPRPAKEKGVKRPGAYWADPLANGTPPVFEGGGRFKNRRKDGAYPEVKLSHPSSVQRFTVGGGHMGHPLACENEAPFPLALAEFIVRGWCPPGSAVRGPWGMRA